MNAKEMIQRNAKKRTKFHYRDRVKMRVLKDVPGNVASYRKDQIINPHRLMAEQLEKDKIAVPV